MNNPKQTLFGLFVALAFTAPLTAQQFQYEAGAIPGTPRWSEGVEACDVDRDGDLDLFFAEGDGFSSPGTQRQSTLVINQLIETGVNTFTNESTARLGVHLSNAKGVSCADVDADGWPDALYANGFNTDPPFLFINRGSAQPGYFNEEAASRGLTSVLNSAAGQFGDLDDDGDLDLILCDAGPSLLSAPGGRPRLYRNDGDGNFTEDAASLNAPIKRAHMDVQLIDIDSDWDLDFVGMCRSTNSGGNHYLMLNDGSGSFTDASSQLPNGTGQTYEAEVGDLDGDSDIDLFLVSLSGYQEGAVRNELSPQGSLSFTAQSPLAGSYDDNEIALCDYDIDGDYDAFVGSLSARERLWRNDGSFSFVNQQTQIQAVNDSTLDCTFADLDNDGDYDFITAQGESNPSQYVNKVYRNNGSPDTRAPQVIAVRGAVLSDAWSILAKAKDAVSDDGVDYVTAACIYSPYPPSDAIWSMDITGGGFQPSNLTINVGEKVSFQNTTNAVQAVQGTSAPFLFSSDVINPGLMWDRLFVSPGTYQITNPLSGATAQITVSGVVEEAAGFKSGGGQFRWALPPTDGLCYELLFKDWQGNVSASDSFEAFGSFDYNYCFGDLGCPCGNDGDFGRGCAHNGSAGGPQGAALSTAGPGAVSAEEFFSLRAEGLVPNQPGLYFQGNNAVNGGSGAPFGDGLRCVGGGVVRLQVAVADSDGKSSTSIGIATKGGVSWGDVKRYQLWYRTPGANSPCASGFNLTNGVEVYWLP